jgi:hypothetical protein
MCELAIIHNLLVVATTTTNNIMSAATRSKRKASTDLVGKATTVVPKMQRSKADTESVSDSHRSDTTANNIMSATTRSKRKASTNLVGNPSADLVGKATTVIPKKQRSKTDTESVLDSHRSDTTAEPDRCVVCFESLHPHKTAKATVPCHGHQYHQQCYKEWEKVNGSCPMCRTTTTCARCGTSESKLSKLKCENTTGQYCDIHKVCPGCTDYALERHACIKCCPPKIHYLGRDNSTILQRVETFLANPDNIHNGIQMVEGIASPRSSSTNNTRSRKTVMFRHSARFIIAVLTIREHPQKHWAYIETQLNRFLRLSILRPNCDDVSNSKRTRAALIALFNYLVNVLNSLPCSLMPRASRHLQIVEMLHSGNNPGVDLLSNLLSAYSGSGSYASKAPIVQDRLHAIVKLLNIISAIP